MSVTIAYFTCNNSVFFTESGLRETALKWLHMLSRYRLDLPNNGVIIFSTKGAGLFKSKVI